MIVVDVNLLLYAYDTSSKFHNSAKQWWEQALSGTDLIGLPWNTILAFLRITTNPRIYHTPYNIEKAVHYVNQWLERPISNILLPTHEHWQILNRLLTETSSNANYVPDAHLAALAIEHGAILYSSDNDFGRFKGLSWENPLI